MQIQHKLRQCAVHASNLPFITTKREPVNLTAAAKSRPSAFPPASHGHELQSQTHAGYPAADFNVVIFVFTYRHFICSRLGMVSAISRISACKASSSLLLHPALRPVCSLPDVKARYFPARFRLANGFRSGVTLRLRFSVLTCNTLRRSSRAPSLSHPA